MAGDISVQCLVGSCIGDGTCKRLCCLAEEQLQSFSCGAIGFKLELSANFKSNCCERFCVLLQLSVALQCVLIWSTAAGP